MAGPPVIEWASPAQRELFEWGPTPVCASGGWNAAKTYACVLKGLYLSDTFPNNRGLIYRQKAVDVRDTTMRTFEKLVPRSKVRSWSDQMGSVVLRNGSEILFRHMDDPDIEDVIKGLEINWFFGNQAEDTDEEIFDKLCARLGRWDQAIVPDRVLQAQEAQGLYWPWRHPVSGRPLPPTYAMIDCNPESDLHWIYSRFHPESPEWQDRWQRLGYRMIFFNTLENRFLTEQNRQELLAHDEEFIRRYVRGEWGIPEGTIHTIPPESVITFTSATEAELFVDRLRASCAWRRVLDHGDSAPTAVGWFCSDRDGNEYVVREYYQPNKLVSDHRTRIAELSVNEVYDQNLADPSIFAKGTGGQKHGQFWSVADEYCLAPSTRILTADLRHVRVDSLHVGDLVAGFDEGCASTKFDHRQSQEHERRWRIATVEAVESVVRPAYRLTLSDGTVVVCSDDHKWLANPTGSWRLWRTTEQLEEGQRLLRMTDVWDEDTSREGGYLAASLNGEGFLTQRGKTQRTGFSQRDNQMLAKVVDILHARHVPFSRSHTEGKHGRIVNLCIGQRPHLLRVLGTSRPHRLLAKFSMEKLGRVHVSAKPTILRKEFIGWIDLISVQTSTRTCVAEGLMSHNCELQGCNAPAIRWIPADNNELGTRNRINEYLRVDPDHIHPVTKQKGAPHLYFLMKNEHYPYGCQYIVRETRAQRRKSLGTVNGRKMFLDERDPTIPDHGYDLARYFIASRPPIAREPVKRARSRSFVAQQRLIAQSRRGEVRA